MEEDLIPIVCKIIVIPHYIMIFNVAETILICYWNGLYFALFFNIKYKLRSNITICLRYKEFEQYQL